MDKGGRSVLRKTVGTGRGGLNRRMLLRDGDEWTEREEALLLCTLARTSRKKATLVEIRRCSVVLLVMPSVSSSAC